MGDRSYKKGTTVSSNGVTVHQLFTDDELEVPAVVLKLVSNRDDPATVRLAVPEPAAEMIGFHPEFEHDSWKLAEGRMVFETSLDPGAELTTLYAVETEDEDRVKETMDTLDVEVVESRPVTESAEADTEPSAEPDAPVDAETEQTKAAASTVADPDETLVDLEDDTSSTLASDFDLGVDEIDTEVVTDEESDEPREMVEFEEIPTRGDETGAEEADELVDDDEHARAATEHTHDTMDERESDPDVEEDMDSDPDVDDSVEAQEPIQDEQLATKTPRTEESLSDIPAEQLFEELVSRVEDDELDEGHRQRLRDIALDEEDDRADVRDAQISHLQSRVSDIETFTNAIEEVFEHHGPPVEVFEEYAEQLSSLQTQVETIEENVSSVETTVTDIETDVDAMRDDVAAVEGNVADVETDVSDLETEVSGVSTDVETLEDELTSVDENVERLEEEQKRLQSDVKTLQSWREKITGALEAFTGE